MSLYVKACAKQTSLNGLGPPPIERNGVINVAVANANISVCAAARERERERERVMLMLLRNPSVFSKAAILSLQNRWTGARFHSPHEASLSR